jgi:hypothetical protein
MECGSGAAALESERSAIAGATALQGAFGTSIFRAESKRRIEGLLEGVNWERRSAIEGCETSLVLS